MAKGVTFIFLKCITVATELMNPLIELNKTEKPFSLQTTKRTGRTGGTGIYSRIFQNIQEYSKIFLSIPKYVKYSQIF